MIASSYIKGGIVHFYNEYNEFSNIEGIAYELGKQLINFTNINIEDLDYALSNLEEIFTDSSFLEFELWKDTDFMDELTAQLDEIMQANIYLSFYNQALLNFAIEYAQDSSRAVMELTPSIDGAEIIDENLDFCSAVKEAKSLIYENALRKIAFIRDELDLLAAINKDERLSKLSPFQKMAYIDTVRYERTSEYFYIETDMKISYIIDHENLENDNPQLEDFTVVEKHDIFGIDDLIKFELMELIKSEMPLKKCRNCCNYFVPANRSDTEYCSRIAEGETKPCNEIGAMKQYEKKVSEDPVYEAYNRAYKRQNSRVRNNKMSQQDFYNWSEQARKLRDDCKAEKISFIEFQEWLNQGKKRDRKPADKSNKHGRYLQSVQLTKLTECILKSNNEPDNAFYFDIGTGEFYSIKKRTASTAYKKFDKNGNADITFTDKNIEKIATEFWENHENLIPLLGENESIVTGGIIKDWAKMNKIRLL